MADSVNVRVEGDLDKVKILSDGADPEISHLLRKAADDIAKRIEKYAKDFAPMGDTGKLKAHPTKRTTITGVAESRAPLFVSKGQAPGTSFAIRGPVGFVKGTAGAGEVGKIVSHIVIELPEEPKYAVWVHEGTGIYGPHHTPIIPTTKPFLVYHNKFHWVRTRSVRGQIPQPYLEKAYLTADATYVPQRVARLREEIKVLLG